MAPSASQVEVQAPPGLESVSGCRLPAPTMPSASGSAERAEGAALHAEQDLKQELVREVTDAVREHIDWKTTAAVDCLWQRGQRAMQYLQQQQNTQTEQLRGQLAACAESYRNLERENAALRTGLEALMKHLTMVFGTPPHAQSPLQPPPMFPPTQSVPAATPEAGPAHELPAAAAAPEVAKAPVATPRVAAAMQSGSGARSDTEDFHTPAASPQRAALAEETAGRKADPLRLPGIPSFPGTSSASTAAVAPSSDAAAKAPAGLGGLEPAAQALPSQTSTAPAVGSTSPAPSFTLTLRRADNVSLGLDVRGQSGSSYLVVEAVRPGGAIEAWNRQCAGDTREIRVGDHITVINGVEEADGMREECLTKHLLKMTVERVPDAPGEQPSGGIAQPQQQDSATGLRADADEFVPQGWARGPSAPPRRTSC